MNVRLLCVILISVAFYSCSKKTDADKGSQNAPEVSLASSTIFYVDTAKIYSTDLNGDNRKLLIGGNSDSDIQKIVSASILPDSGKILYAYLSKSGSSTKIAVANPDGTASKVIKESVTVQFVKGISYGRVYYAIVNPFSGAGVFEFRWMNDDGSSDTRTEYTPLAPVNIHEEEVSYEGRGFLVNGSKASTFIPIFNNRVSQPEGRTILSSTSDFVTAPILSADATKIAYVLKSAMTGKYDIRIKDFSVNGPEQPVYTLTVPSAGIGAVVNPAIHLYWVNGTKNLLISYGKFSSPAGALSDYTYCQLLDIASATISKSWTFTGDGNVKVIAD